MINEEKSEKIQNQKDRRRETRKQKRKTVHRQKTDNRQKIKMYTDGSCFPNPGRGGWGVLICVNNEEIQLYGGEENTTNNQMEMMAAIKGLQYLEYPSIVLIKTDSKYLKNGITKWIDNWKRNGWRTFSGEKVKNQDLWQTLDLLCGIHKVLWQWVKAHNGHRENEIADELARKGQRNG